MSNMSFPSPNPRRVAAGRRNQLLCRGLTVEGRERLRSSALQHKPWEHSTGPQTPAGKAQTVANGKRRQKGHRSVRELRRELVSLRELLATIREHRQLLTARPLDLTGAF